MFKYFVNGLQKLNWPLRHKFGLSFGLVLACFVFNGLNSLILITNIQKSEQQQQRTAIYLERLGRYELAYRSLVFIYSEENFSEEARYIRDNFLDIINEELHKRNRIAADEATEQFLKSFDTLYNNAYSHLLEIESFLIVNQTQEARTLRAKYSDDFNKVTQLLTARRQYLEQARLQVEAQVGDALFFSIGLIIAATLFSVGLVLFLLVLIERAFVKPLNRLHAGLVSMAEGNLAQQLQVLNRDEIGKLAVGFSHALTSLQQVLKGVQISQSLQEVTSQLTLASQQQASGAAGQVTALTQVMSSMKELGSTAEQIADNATQVAGLVGQTMHQINMVKQAGNSSYSQTHQMVEMTKDTLQVIQGVGRQVGEFSSSMNKLNEQTELLDRLVNLIGTLAAEVHLLSLNAAIEAAGAGQYGERFKIVARHVKELANRAGTANEEARLLISGVRSSSQQALSDAEQGQLEIQALLQSNTVLCESLYAVENSVQQVETSVEQLVVVAGQVDLRAREIQQATQQQHQAHEQVIFSALSIQEIASQTSLATEQVAGSSNLLEKLALQLGTVLNQIRLAL